MGSEMCIRDRHRRVPDAIEEFVAALDRVGPVVVLVIGRVGPELGCLLYTSDAADERSSVDLGGRRIIKKKKTRGEVRGD